MTALRAKVAYLKYPVFAELPLHVQKVLHGVRRRMIVRGDERVRRWYLCDGSTSSGIALFQVNVDVPMFELIVTRAAMLRAISKYTALPISCI